MISDNLLDLLPTIIPVAIFLFFFGIIGIAIYFDNVHRKRRMKAMEKLSLQIGFTFKENIPSNQIRPFFDLMNIGHSRMASNIIEGKHRHLRTQVIDYSYTTGSGKHQSTYSQTVIIKKIPEALFPRFTLKKEGFWHRVGNFFGYKDIDFDGFKVFSDKYFLKGKDEKSIRKLFSPKLLKHFEYNDPEFNIEAAEDSILFYKLGKRLKPEEIYQKMDKCASIASAFQERFSVISNSEGGFGDEDVNYEGNYVVKNGKVNFEESVKSNDTFTAYKNLGVQPVSGLAVGALIMAFLLPILGLILAAIALSKFKKEGSSNTEKHMSIAALIISIFQMLFWTFTIFMAVSKAL